MIIGISGWKRNGKDAVSKYLAFQYDFCRTKFAAPLKEMLRAMLKSAGVSALDIERMIEGDLKELPSEILGGHTPVHAMQTLGTEWGRGLIGKEFWVGLWKARALQELSQGRQVVVDDLRFKNEGDALKSLGGISILIHGRVTTRDPHSSEDLSWLTSPDYTIDNSGSLEELYDKVDRIIGDIKYKSSGIATHR